jgi:hypothetical protein
MTVFARLCPYRFAGTAFLQLSESQVMGRFETDPVPNCNENAFLTNKYGIYSPCRNAVGRFGSFITTHKEAIRWPKKIPQSHWIKLSPM